MVYTGRMYTVHQLAKIAGITRRTLHYYDQIGLLQPSRLGENGYRYYDQDALLRLQQILLYRELDLPLEQIREMLSSPKFEVLAALENHKAELLKRIQRLQRLVLTVDQTKEHLQGKRTMSDEQLFYGISEEQQAEYEKEARQMYDQAVVNESNRRWKSYSAAEKKRIGEEGEAVYRSFVQAMPHGPASPQAQASVTAWRQHLQHFWSPNAEEMLGLADLYNDDPRFKANFDGIHPQLAAFMREAIRVFVSK